MYTSNNQVIFEEIYDENIQPTEEEIIEYANFLGIDAQDVNEYKIFKKIKKIHDVNELLLKN